MFADFDKRKMVNSIIDEYNNVIFRKEYEIKHIKWWGYRLGVYIGGNNPAPHTIKIDIQNI